MCMKICCVNTDYGVDTFYLIDGNKKLYLFDQSRRKGVEDYFGGSGVTIDRALKLPKYTGKNSDRKFDTALRRTIDKLPMYLKYIEKEHGIVIFEKKRRKYEKN